MNKNIKPIDENERNINWKEVEYKIKIICNKFNNIDSRFKDDLAQELRIHAFYISDDYYDLTRKAIDFWRTLQVRVMPEVPYFDLELFGGMKADDTDLHFHEIVDKLRSELKKENASLEPDLQELALDILEVILDDLIERNPTINLREFSKYKPYHNSRVSCSYLWDVMGESSGSIEYRKIRKALKLLESLIKDLAKKGEIDIDDSYLKD